MEKLVFEEFASCFGPWADRFRPFIESKEMYDIYEKLKSDARYPDGRQKEIIVPSSDNTFRSFSTCNPGNLKTIWYMMDPYAKRYKNKALQATGIAMDCSNSPDGKLQPSLEKFYEGIEDDLGIKVEYSPSLEYLQNQGVMLTNTDLTCKLNKTGSHSGLWEPFNKFFLEEVMYGFTGIIYVLAGKESHRMEKHINPLGNYIIKLEHPVSASYKNSKWNHNKVFSTINRIIKENNNETIYWNKKDWINNNQPPF